MDLTLSAQDEAFRGEVRAFLDAHLPEDLSAGAAATPTVFAEWDVASRWQRILHEKGWLAYHWPVEHGGTGWTPTQRYIFERECALAGAPELPVLGLRLLASVLHAFGTPEQQQYYLPRILSGEDVWCQGFSEPGAGSDLAGLKTRAVRDGDRYVVNGSKLWTTYAHFANRIFALVRTDPDVRPQAGITFLMLDMAQPGISVSPILSMAGDHEVNAVFLDDATTPVADRVGDEGAGWKVAKHLLEMERGGSCHAPKLLADLARIRATAAMREGDDGAPLDRDPLFAAAYARALFEAQALETTELRILAEIARGNRPGPQTSLVKMVASTLRQEVDMLAMRLEGYDGLQYARARPLHGQGAPGFVGSPAAQVAPLRYLNSRAWTIFGGSNEVQRTIIARTVLGL